MEHHLIAESANGHAVYINLVSSAAGSAVARNPHLLNLLQEIISQVQLTLPTIMLTCDMKRTIGYAETVLAADGDNIFYARELKATSYTRFIKNHQPAHTSKLSLRLKRTAEQRYEVTSIRLGGYIPPLPGAADASAKSLSYWKEHAIVYNGQPLIASTLTKQCPYEPAVPASA